MKRLFLFIKMVFVQPTMFFSRLHAKKLGFDGRFQIARTWAKFIIGNSAVKLEVKNTHLIPLEDGYTFISNHSSKYDGIFLLAGQPLDFSFFVSYKTRLPYMTPFLSFIESLLTTKHSEDDDLIRMNHGLRSQHNYHLFLTDLQEGETGTNRLDAAYLSKTAIIPVAIKNAGSFMKFGHQVVTLSFCTPLHFEEYGNQPPAVTLNDIKQRLKIELKEG
jgi:hypothetical protein